MHRVLVIVENQDDRDYEAVIIDSNCSLSELCEMQREDEVALADCLGFDNFDVTRDFMSFLPAPFTTKFKDLKEQFTVRRIRERMLDE